MVYIGTRTYRYGRMIMSHVIAESLEELHDMAAKLGVARIHFQDKPGRPHYDICQANVHKALDLGAVRIDDREIIRICNKHYS